MEILPGTAPTIVVLGSTLSSEIPRLRVTGSAPRLYLLFGLVVDDKQTQIRLSSTDEPRPPVLWIGERKYVYDLVTDTHLLSRTLQEMRR